jgi:hypothetical protein
MGELEPEDVNMGEAHEAESPQGLPISPILFLIYNTPLIRACTGKFINY